MCEDCKQDLIGKDYKKNPLQQLQKNCTIGFKSYTICMRRTYNNCSPIKHICKLTCRAYRRPYKAIRGCSPINIGKRIDLLVFYNRELN